MTCGRSGGCARSLFACKAVPSAVHLQLIRCMLRQIAVAISPCARLVGKHSLYLRGSCFTRWWYVTHVYVLCRAAASHAHTWQVPLYERGYEKDPAKVAAEAIRVAQRDGRDVVLVDTAGRMQVRTHSTLCWSDACTVCMLYCTGWV
jgi:hypothetical protein